MLENIRSSVVSAEAYFPPTELSQDLKLEVNDALALDVMRQNEVMEIYLVD